jgi:hypothetical protein
MNKNIKLGATLAIALAYCLILRYIAPSHEPYFLLSIGLIGYIAWLYGTPAGLISALLLIPITTHIYQQFDVSTSYITFASSPAFIAIEILAAVALGSLRQRNLLVAEKEAALTATNETLQNTLAQVKELGGLHSICTSCHKIQDDDGAWMRVDSFLMEKTKMEFSHAICPNCISDFSESAAPPTAEDEEQE